MPLLRWSKLPNAITIGRIVLAPVVFFLLFIPTFTARFIAWLLFLAAAFSDLWDGYLARKHGWVSNFGKLIDPIADKLLLICTFLPFYILSHRADPTGVMPVITTFPLWVLLVVFGRELGVTGLRSYAARYGRILPAGKEGKLKTVFQNIFIGTAIFWLALQAEAVRLSWAGTAWRAWQAFHGAVFLVSLGIALVLTVYSLVVYLSRWRKGERAL